MKKVLYYSIYNFNKRKIFNSGIDKDVLLSETEEEAKKEMENKSKEIPEIAKKHFTILKINTKYLDKKELEDNLIYKKNIPFETIINKTEFEEYNIQQKFLQLAEKMSQSFNVEINEYLGGGCWGRAYSTNCDKVLKITTDKDEFHCSDLLVGEHNVNVANIYQTQIINQEYFAILLEKLDTKKITKKFTEKEFYEVKMNFHNEDYERLNQEEIDLMADLERGIEEIFNKTGIDARDLELENIGYKKNGKIAVFDQKCCYADPKMAENYIKKIESKKIEEFLSSKTKIKKNKGIKLK